MNKVWTVESNTGERAQLSLGSERVTVKRPNTLTVEEFYSVLRPGTYILDSALKTVLNWR
jgi:hypothetical protein